MDAASLIDTTEVGTRLRRSRKDRGLSQAALAADILSASALSGIERELRPVDLETLHALARRLDVPLSALLLGTPCQEAAGRIMIETAEHMMRTERAPDALALLDLDLVPDEYMTRALRTRGTALEWTGHYEEAIDVLLQALSRAEDEGDARLVAYIITNIAYAYYDLLQAEEALGWFRRAYEWAARIDDRKLLGQLLTDMGHIYMFFDDPNTALGYYERSRQYLETVGDVRSMATLYSGISETYLARRHFEEAERYSRLAMTAVEASRDSRGLAIETNRLAGILVEAGRLDEAMSLAEEGLSTSRELEAPEIEAVSRNVLAKVHLTRGNLAAADREAQEAMTIAPEGTSLGRLSAWRTLAEIAEHRGLHGEADNYFEQAISVYRESGLYRECAQVALRFSQILKHRGDAERALNYGLYATEVIPRPAQ